MRLESHLQKKILQLIQTPFPKGGKLRKKSFPTFLLWDSTCPSSVAIPPVNNSRAALSSVSLTRPATCVCLRSRAGTRACVCARLGACVVSRGPRVRVYVYVCCGPRDLAEPPSEQPGRQGDCGKEGHSGPRNVRTLPQAGRDLAESSTDTLSRCVKLAESAGRGNGKLGTAYGRISVAPGSLCGESAEQRRDNARPVDPAPIISVWFGGRLCQTVHLETGRSGMQAARGCRPLPPSRKSGMVYCLPFIGQLCQLRWPYSDPYDGPSITIEGRPSCQQGAGFSAADLGVLAGAGQQERAICSGHWRTAAFDEAPVCRQSCGIWIEPADGSGTLPIQPWIIWPNQLVAWPLPKPPGQCHIASLSLASAPVFLFWWGRRFTPLPWHLWPRWHPASSPGLQLPPQSWFPTVSTACLQQPIQCTHICTAQPVTASVPAC